MVSHVTDHRSQTVGPMYSSSRSQSGQVSDGGLLFLTRLQVRCPMMSSDSELLRQRDKETERDGMDGVPGSGEPDNSWRVPSSTVGLPATGKKKDLNIQQDKTVQGLGGAVSVPWEGSIESRTE